MSQTNTEERRTVLSPDLLGAFGIGEEPRRGQAVARLAQEAMREERERQRRTPLRPSELRRRSRMVTVTFSSARTVERLRALAERWDMQTSELVEFLLSGPLSAAEQGRLGRPHAARPERDTLTQREAEPEPDLPAWSWESEISVAGSPTTARRASRTEPG